MNSSSNVIDISSRFKSDVTKDSSKVFDIEVNTDPSKNVEYLLNIVYNKAGLFYPNLDIKYIKMLASSALHSAFTTMIQNGRINEINSLDIDDTTKAFIYYDDTCNLALRVIIEYIKMHKDEFL